MIWLILLLALNFGAVAYFATRCTKNEMRMQALQDDFALFKGQFDKAVFSRMASAVDGVQGVDA